MENRIPHFPFPSSQFPVPNPQSPLVSIVIPTLNAERTLKDCLDSIASQNYPHENLEIIIADGGSTDETLQIVEDFRAKSSTINVRVLENKLKTGEAGKAVGIKAANNDVIALIDSDNILPDQDWLKSMVEPFKDPEIIASEPIEYTYRKIDGYITRYTALIGMSDPLCFFLGNYDRYSHLSGKWTGLPIKHEDKGEYLKVELKKGALPTIGANGFLIKRSILNACKIDDYLFDIDIICQLLSSDSQRSVKIAKVKTGIVHIFSGNISTFIRKQNRRIRDYLYFRKAGIRRYPWQHVTKLGLIKFVLSCILVLPLLVQSIKGFIRKADFVWFFHPVACWITLVTYGVGTIYGLIAKSLVSREKWSQ